PNPEVTEAVVKAPEGIEYRLELAYPMLPFDNTGQYGVYELTQKIGETEKVSSFAVNFPTESESVNGKPEVDISQEASEVGNTSGGTRLQEWLLGLLLILAAVEWVVYIRGY
ncbi:MAG: hypothetical protein PHC45_08760, partial [Clostridiaceae bacterium]|nr:hypothetical protein [Clostridiaceae bacterium]